MKRSPLRPVSAKRAKENAERKRLMEATFGPPDTWHCTLWGDPRVLVMGPCHGPIHGHELLKRSQGGSITDMENIILLCDYHNGWIENEPAKAYAWGLTRHPWEGL